MYMDGFVSGVQDFLSHEHRVFNSEEFLRTREPADQLFYKKVHSHLYKLKKRPLVNTKTLTALTRFSLLLSQVLETHIFHSFLRDRLNRKWDTFSRMEQNTRNLMHKYDKSMMSSLVSVWMLISSNITRFIKQSQVVALKQVQQVSTVLV